MGRKLSDTARPLTRLATLDSEPDRLLKLWQEAGRIPTHYIDKYGSKIPYTSWDQIDKEYLTRIEAAERLLSPTELKKSKAKIAQKVREEMGITYKNVLGNHTLLVGPSSTDDIRGLNKRAIREDINIEAENWIRKKKGDGVFESYKKRLLKEWNTVNKRDMANVRKWFHSAAGKAKLHRGHGFAALVGGGLLADNVAAEIGWRNVGHGPAPRFSVEIMEALNMPKNDLEGFYFYDLKKKGLTISNKPNTPLMLAADTGAISPNQLELIQLKLDDLRAQGVSSQTIDRFSQDVSELGRETTGGNVRKGQIKPETWKNRPTIRRKHRPKQYTAATAYGNVQEGLAKRRAIATAAGKKFGLNIRSIDPLQSFWREVKQNPLGSAMGGIYGLAIDPMYREALQAKDPLQAGLILGTDIAAGAVAEGAGKFGLNIASRIAPTTTANTLSALNPALQAVSKVAGPVMLAYQAGGSQDIRKLKRATPESIQRYERETGRSATSDETAVAGLSEEESRQYLSGGGNTAMTKYGWTMEQTMQQGRKNLAKQEAFMYKNGGYTAD